MVHHETLFSRFFIYFVFFSDKGPMLKTLDYAIRIGSTTTILYFDFYIYIIYIYRYIYSKNNQQTDECGNIYKIFHGGTKIWILRACDENKSHTVPSYVQATVKFSFYYMDSMQKL